MFYYKCVQICKAVVNDAVFRRLPKHPEKAHANTCCEMVRIFHQVFKVCSSSSKLKLCI